MESEDLNPLKDENDLHNEFPLLLEDRENFELQLFPEKEVKADSSAIYKKSAQIIDKLQADGRELITNVAVCAQERTANQRLQADQNDASRTEFLLKHQSECEEQFNKLISKWDSKSDSKIPQKLKKHLTDLRHECEDHLKAKDVIIAKLKTDIKAKNEEFTMSSVVQEQEIQLMSQRIKELISNLYETAMSESTLIQNTLEKIRVETMTEAIANMDKRFEDKEISNKKYEDFHETVWKNTENLRRTRLIEQDKVASLRSQLEKDAHNFLMQLREVEAIQFLNLDKLKYSLYVMQQQVKENKLVSCDMKRYNIQAFDWLIAMKAYLKAINKEGDRAYQQQLAYIKNFQKKFSKDIERAKNRHESQRKLFLSVFKHKQKEIETMVREVLALDKFVFENLLEIEFESPNLSFLKQQRVSTDCEEKQILQWLDFFTKENSETGESNAASHPADFTEATSEALFYLQRPLNVEKLLEFVCSELDFLLNEKILEIAKRVYPNWKTFILGNSTFNSVGITTMMDLKVFMAHVLKQAKKLNNDEHVLSTKEVLAGFYEFIEYQKNKIKSDEIFFDVKPIEDMRKEAQFWEPYAKILPPEKEQLWDAAIYGLEKYHNALENLHNLSQKKKNFLNQRQELQLLLRNPKDDENS